MIVPVGSCYTGTGNLPSRYIRHAAWERMPCSFAHVLNFMHLVYNICR